MSFQPFEGDLRRLTIPDVDETQASCCILVAVGQSDACIKVNLSERSEVDSRSCGTRGRRGRWLMIAGGRDDQSRRRRGG